jgi:hypothetical protein
MVDRLGVGIGDIDEEFDRWFVKQLEQTELGNLLDMPNDELMEAGNGTGELGAWVAVAGSMRGRLFTTLSPTTPTTGSTGWAS